MNSDVSGVVFWDDAMSLGCGFRRFGTGLLECDAMSLGYVDSDVSGLTFWDMTL